MMVRLLGYTRPYRASVVGAVALVILSSLLQLVGPLATAVALDLFIRPGEVEAPVSRWLAEHWLAVRAIDPAAGLALVAGVYLLTLVLTSLVLYFQGLVMQMMGQRIMADLREEIFAHLQRLSIAYFDRHPIGRLVTRVTNDVDALNELFTAGLVSIFGDVVLLGGIVLALFWLDWRLALATFAILPLLLGLSIWFKVRARQTYRRVRLKLARINSFLQEHLTGMSVVQLFGRERATASDFGHINDEHRVANLQAIFYYAVYYPMVELITALGIGLILFYGGGKVMGGALSLGVLVAFLQYAQRFYQPLADLSEKYNILQSAIASSERVFGLLDTEPTIADVEDPWRPESIRGAVELDDVWFSYEEGEPVLRGVSFRLEPGETVAIVGHTGAGKSTLANLLLRFYDVDSGVVRIDGRDVRHWHLGDLRRAIGLVLQDVFLFSGTIADNIRLGEEGLGDAAVEEAAREVHAHEFIARLEGGYGAAVQERGSGLSVGQKQLIAFARALAFDPRILILDEATSSIDTETEQLIQRALGRLLAGRTNLVIAHRLSTIQHADRILVMHKGELREQGTHRELLAADGIYARLHQLQYRDTRSLG
ncbi:MAG: ABC transporter ATP-binding protein [Acidobacteria bacterium]|nr:ABC transporter ATP-binding protein [Acidobacteriota bacterium]